MLGLILSGLALACLGYGLIAVAVFLAGMATLTPVFRERGEPLYALYVAWAALQWPAVLADMITDAKRGGDE